LLGFVHGGFNGTTYQKSIPQMGGRLRSSPTTAGIVFKFGGKILTEMEYMTKMTLVQKLLV
jgi:hypothetical protein